MYASFYLSHLPLFLMRHSIDLCGQRIPAEAFLSCYGLLELLQFCIFWLVFIFISVLLFVYTVDLLVSVQFLLISVYFFLVLLYGRHKPMKTDF